MADEDIIAVDDVDIIQNDEDCDADAEHQQTKQQEEVKINEEAEQKAGTVPGVVIDPADQIMGVDDNFSIDEDYVAANVSGIILTFFLFVKNE